MRFLLAALLLSSAIASAAPSPPPPAAADVRLPAGTRTDAHGQLVSARGLRDTTDVIAKDLARRGVVAKQIGPYRRRGVELTRFVSQTPSTTWLAIHILRTGGKTLIFFVPRSSS